MTAQVVALDGEVPGDALLAVAHMEVRALRHSGNEGVALQRELSRRDRQSDRKGAPLLEGLALDLRPNDDGEIASQRGDHARRGCLDGDAAETVRPCDRATRAPLLV